MVLSVVLEALHTLVVFGWLCPGPLDALLALAYVGGSLSVGLLRLRLNTDQPSLSDTRLLLSEFCLFALALAAAAARDRGRPFLLVFCSLLA